MVLELSGVLAGPAVGMFFAELGARVIKVENNRTAGDVTRQWKTEKEPEESDISSYFSSVNWGKESLSVDLRKNEGIAIVKSLAEKADIILTSFKHGDAERLGLNYERLKVLNPSVLYGEITGFGPNDSRVGYDAIIQAEAGFTFMNGMPDGPPLKMPVALMDLMAAHQLKEGLLTAIIRKQQTGNGQKVSTSLIQSGISSLANQATNWLVGGKIPQRTGSEHPNIAPYGTIFYTKDDQPLVLAIGSNRQFIDFCRILNQPDLAGDPHFKTNHERVKNRSMLNKTLEQIIAKWQADPLIKALSKHNIPIGRVLDMKAIFEKPEAQSLLLTSECFKGLKTIAFRETEHYQNNHLAPPPHLNAEGEAILKQDLGYADERIQAFIQEAVIG